MKKLIVFLLGLSILLVGCGPKVDNGKVFDHSVEVNEAIDSFIEKYAKDYIKLTDKPILNENVIAAIHALEINGYDVSLNDYISDEDLSSYYKDKEFTSIGEAYRTAVIFKSFGLNYDNVTNYLETLTEVDVQPWDYTYGLIVLRNTNTNQTLQNELQNKLNIIKEEDYRDADYAGYSLIASSGLDIEKEALYGLIDNNLSKNGVISWGNPNASVTASVILGLIADGVDPISEKYITEDVDLIEALLSYEVKGAFKNLINDEEVDTMFATPQAFSALVSYKLYKENKPANILLP